MEQLHPVARAGAGTDILFPNSTDSDEMAVQNLYEMKQMAGRHLDEVEMCDHPFMDLQEMPGDSFLCHRIHPFEISDTWSLGGLRKTKAGAWQFKSGHGIRSPNTGGYVALKRCYAYHEDGHKTNRIMNVYSLIYENGYTKIHDIHLCHVFQSDNYDPRPKRPLDYLAFYNIHVISLMEDLEALQKNPNAFKDIAEFDPPTFPINFSRGKQANVWEDFTEIRVLGPKGVKVATLAICGPCSMVYLTGTLSEDKKEKGKYKFKNNGTKTLKEHKCSGQQHHISGNPQ